MLYFFEKGVDFIRCELRPRHGLEYDLIVTEPAGCVRIEHYPDPGKALRRWEQLLQGLETDGWAGPFGRD